MRVGLVLRIAAGSHNHGVGQGVVAGVTGGGAGGANVPASELKDGLGDSGPLMKPVAAPAEEAASEGE